MSVSAMDELFLMGLRTTTEGLPAFLNCTAELLLNDYLTLLPKELIVGEIRVMLWAGKKSNTARRRCYGISAKTSSAA